MRLTMRLRFTRLAGRWASQNVQAHPVSQDRWRASAHRLVALVHAGATFINGKLVERPG